MDINNTLLDAQFKDASPMATVNHIRDIIHSYNIETEEIWSESNVPYCFSLRLNIVGTTFGVNGKGLTKQFALASAYGELMERLQLGFVGSLSAQKTGATTSDYTNFPQSSPENLLQKAPQIYDELSKKLKLIMNVSLTPQEILKQFSSPKGEILCIPCFELTAGKTLLFPERIRTRVYGSNGCAAGNTMEEAIVQAVSETVERHNQGLINLNHLTPPDVPEEELQKYKVAYDIITYVRAQGYRVEIKDCSLGEKFPVVCACFIHEKTGKYHTHFGAYPLFEIALERALTESFQGRNIDNIAKFSDFIYNSSQLAPIDCLTEEFFTGATEKLPCIFAGTPSFPYNPDANFSGTTNLELLRECIDYFRVKGHSILVYDRSVLGFPTCQVMIPGYSEVFVNRLHSKTDGHRYASLATRTLRYPAKASIQDMLGLLMHQEDAKNRSRNDYKSIGFLNAANINASLSGQEQARLMNASMGYVYYALGQFSEAIAYADKLISGTSGDDASYLIALKRFLCFRLHKKDMESIREILSHFHSNEIVEKLYANTSNGRNPFEPYTLRCEMNCTENCQLFNRCSKKRHMEISRLINEKLEKMDFTAFCNTMSQLICENTQ